MVFFGNSHAAGRQINNNTQGGTKSYYACPARNGEISDNTQSFHYWLGIFNAEADKTGHEQVSHAPADSYLPIAYQQ
jgi:hypothetical protein